MKLSILILSTIFVVGCSVEKVQWVTSIDFLEIGHGTLSGSDQEQIEMSNLVITNESDWTALQSNMNTVNDVTGTFTVTDIDFDEHMIIVVILDIKPSCWDVSITNIHEFESKISVLQMDEQSACLAITQPFHIVRIPLTSKTIEFL